MENDQEQNMTKRLVHSKIRAFSRIFFKVTERMCFFDMDGRELELNMIMMKTTHRAAISAVVNGKSELFVIHGGQVITISQVKSIKV